MGRPRIDPASVRRPCAQPPADMSPRMLALWHREFDRFPPGYYVPADVNGMLVYLHTVAEYDAAMARAAAARKPADARAERVEVRAIRKQMFTMQRALRMYPSTRQHPTTASNAVNAPTPPAMPESRDVEEPGWRSIFREAGVLPDERRPQ